MENHFSLIIMSGAVSAFYRTPLTRTSLFKGFAVVSNKFIRSARNMVYVSALIFFLKAVTVFAFNTIDDTPDPKNTALMARYIVHNSNWTSVSYISNQNETKGLPLAALFSISDGPMDSGTGVPYFYVSMLQQAVTDLMESSNNCSLMMSLAQTNICSSKHLDPEDPRCAHVVLVGTFQKINNDTAEYETAKTSVFIRHPTFRNLPESHHFFFAKLNITYIVVQDMFGGPSVVSVFDYFKVHDVFNESSDSSSRNHIFLFTLLFILICLLS